MNTRSSTSRDWRKTTLLFVITALAVVSYYSLGEWYKGYTIAAAGLHHIHTSELVYFAWYTFFGVLTVGSLSSLFFSLSLTDKFLALTTKWSERPVLLVSGLSLFVFVAILSFQSLILLYEPICDDELTYRFISQTLLFGRVTNPVPPDPLFFKNVFVLITSEGWHGKYPIGHPLMLAIGELANLRFLIPPLLTVGSLWMTYKLGRLLFEKSNIPVLAVVLLSFSPQFVLTGGTELSQVSSTFFVLLGVLTLLRFEETQFWGWGLFSGFCWGFEVLVRPMPGVLFLPVVGLYVLLFFRVSEGKARIKAALLGFVPILAVGALFLTVNSLQSGDALVTGYQQAHGKTYLNLTHQFNLISSSVSAALLRQNFWLLGVPFVCLFLLFVKHQRPLWLLWGVIFGVYSYRFLFPKTVVSTTGPVYVAELTPLLLLLIASGIENLKERLQQYGISSAGKRLSCLLMATITTSTLLFVPVQLKQLHAGAKARKTLMNKLEPRLYQDALVFVNKMVRPEALKTWAYSPPNPHPGLKERVIFVRLQYGLKGAKKCIDFWKRRFPKRAAWVFYYYKNKPVLKSVSSARDLVPEAYWRHLNRQKNTRNRPNPTTKKSRIPVHRRDNRKSVR